MFQTVPLSIIRSLFTWSCSKTVYKPVWHTPLPSVQWINSWWWTDELSETCRVSCQNKFVKLMHLVGFITKKFVTLHSHMNVKKRCWHNFGYAVVTFDVNCILFDTGVVYLLRIYPFEYCTQKFCDPPILIVLS